MKLKNELFEEIKKELIEDFPEIESITQNDQGIIKIYANDDILWSIYDILQNGVKSIELNAGRNEKHYLLITV